MGISSIKPAVNSLKAKIAAGEAVLGVWSIIPSPVVVEIFALGGIDFVILDMEHGIFDVTALDSCIRTCESAGGVPLVRIPGLNPSAAQWALDLGDTSSGLTSNSSDRPPALRDRPEPTP